MPKNVYECYDLDDGSVMVVHTSTPYGVPKAATVVIYRQMEDKSWEIFHHDVDNHKNNRWESIDGRIVPHDIKYARLGHVSAIRKGNGSKRIRKLEEYRIR